MSNTGRIGAELTAGEAEAELGVGGVDVGKADVEASVSAGVKGLVGRKFTFADSGDPEANRAAADEFTDYVKWTQGAKEAGNLVQPAVGIGLGLLTDVVYRTVNDYSPPAPTATIVEGGA